MSSGEANCSRILFLVTRNRNSSALRSIALCELPRNDTALGQDYANKASHAVIYVVVFLVFYTSVIVAHLIYETFRKRAKDRGEAEEKMDYRGILDMKESLHRSILAEQKQIAIRVAGTYNTKHNSVFRNLVIMPAIIAGATSARDLRGSAALLPAVPEVSESSDEVSEGGEFSDSIASESRPPLHAYRPLLRQHHATECSGSDLSLPGSFVWQEREGSDLIHIPSVIVSEEIV